MCPGYGRAAIPGAPWLVAASLRSRPGPRAGPPGLSIFTGLCSYEDMRHVLWIRSLSCDPIFTGYVGNNLTLDEITL